MATVYRPFDKNCACELAVCGERSRRDTGIATESVRGASSAGAPPTRMPQAECACRRSSVACTRIRVKAPHADVIVDHVGERHE
jgi:hypothetical protein